MTGTTNILSVQNMQTVVAVSFVLALLSLAFNFYTFNQTTTLAMAASINNANVQKNHNKIEALNQRLVALEVAAKTLAPAPVVVPTPAPERPENPE